MNLKKHFLGFAALACCLGIYGAEKWQKEYEYQVPASQKLRGYGSVETKSQIFKSASGAKVRVTEFICMNDKKASTLAGKFLADLNLSKGLKEIKIKIGDKEVPAKETSSGTVFIGSVDGTSARIISADSVKDMSDFLNQNPDTANGAVAASDYPMYLDRFDRYGWGMYGLGGFSNFHGWMKKCEPKNEKKDPTEDLDFLVKYNFRFEPWLDPSNFDTSDGIIKNTEAEWMVQEANKKGLPVSFRVYGDCGGANWTARRFPEFYDQPAKFMMSGWHGPKIYWKAQPHMSWNTDYYRYMTTQTMRMLRKYKDNPMVMGWMYPAGELAHDSWYDMQADYSENAQKFWRDYLKEKGCDLKVVSKMYGKKQLPFTDWSQVPVPEFATFAGLAGRIKSLAGIWYYRNEKSAGEGVKDKWGTDKFNVDGWKSIYMPGNDKVFDVFQELIKNKNEQSRPNEKLTRCSWFRRDFDLNPELLKKNKDIYLYWFPITHIGIHSGEKRIFHEIYINGKKAGEIGQWGALNVSKELKGGTNSIALRLVGAVWNGRIFLSTEKPSVYPYLGQERNKLWTLWKAWISDVKKQKSAEIFDGMRQEDGNRPIKFMAPIRMGSERWLDLCKRYGSWGHFTGEGIWFFPWYKRYGYLYGLPGTSETAGPAKNVKDQNNSFRRIFLAGLNGHDAVFLTQTYTRDPELRKWWIDHVPVLKRLGRFDLYGPQVLIFRSTRETITNSTILPYPKLGKATRMIQNPWNWDIGRGTLQTIGHSYLYIDDLGVKDGKMAGYKVMFDCGNETMSPKSIEAIKKWVESGGTFVTLPFTGRNSSQAPDSWPIESLTGCKVEKMREPGKGTVTIKKDQSLFKKMAGKNYPDNGHSMDYVGNELNNLSVELVPGKDCEVIATYENGKPAIIRRKLGKGSVIVLGSAFWRNAQDIMGLWRPQGIEAEFVGELLENTGFGLPMSETDDKLVWAQPYRSVNGLNFVTVLVSWNEDKDKDVNVKLRLPAKPQNILCYGVDGIKKLPFEWQDGTATVKVNMPAKEVKVLAADVYGHSSVVDHWWNRQQRYWAELAKPAVDFAPYRQGKYLDPTLDLRENAKLTNKKPAGDKWLEPGFDAKNWKDCILGILNFNGAEANKPVWVRKEFEVPAKWASEGGKILLCIGGWVGSGYQGQAKMYLNGKLLRDFSSGNYTEYDVTKSLNDGKNVLAFEFKGDSKYQGFIGDAFLYHWLPPFKSVSLAGIWSGFETKTDKAIEIKLPGKTKSKELKRTIFIPEAWRNKYDVRLYIDSNGKDTIGAYINNFMVRRHHHRFGSVTDIDITSKLKFGKENEIELLGNRCDINNIRLDLRKKQD
jgi:hypothetical protein